MPENEPIIVVEEKLYQTTIPVEELQTNGNKVTETVEVAQVVNPEATVIPIDSAFPAMGAPNESLNHSLLTLRDMPDQHPITAITGLRAELDHLETLKINESSGKYQANYYIWADGNPSHENRDGFFVALGQDSDTICLCTSTNNIYGVTVSSAGFVGGQSDTARTDKYALVISTGVAPVRCETDVVAGDYVTANNYGVAKKTDGTYGYYVSEVRDIEGARHAIIALTVASNHLRNTANSVQDFSTRMDNVESNIVSVTNIANEAYGAVQNISVDVNALSTDITGKVNEALEKSQNVSDIANNLGEVVAASNTTAVQARAIAEGAAVAAEGIRQEAVSIANQALVDVISVQREVQEFTNDVESRIQQAESQLTDTIENNINAFTEQAQSELDEAKTNAKSAVNQVSSLVATMQPLSEWTSPDGTQTGVSGFVSDTDAKKATLLQISQWKSEMEDDNNSESIASLRTQATAHGSAIDTLSSWKSDVESDVSSIAQIKQTATDQASEIEQLNAFNTGTTTALTRIEGKADSNQSKIDAITTWKSGADTKINSIAGIKETADANHASIEQLTSWKDEATESLSTIQQKADANETSIGALNSWKSGVDTSIASISQKASNNESNISSLATVQGQHSASIAAVETKASTNETNISTIASWKGNVENDVSSIASISTKANANEASIGGLVTWKGTTDTAISNIQQTVSDQGSSITALTSWKNDASASIASVISKADANESSISSLTTSQNSANTSITNLEQKATDQGAMIQGLVANADRYSVGEYSPTYGLSSSEASAIIGVGTVYIPSAANSETFDTGHTRSFSVGRSYTWGGTQWNESASIVVSFSTAYFAGSSTTPFWVVLNNNVTNDGITYEAGTLYLWQNNQWVAVATLSGNATSRSISLVRQQANEISAQVTAIDGSVGALEIQADANETQINSIATNLNGLSSTLATVQQKANDNGASIALVAQSFDDNGQLKQASIINAINGNESSTTISADKINLDGYVTVSSLGTGGTTTIDGSRITTGTISADRIDSENLQITAHQVDFDVDDYTINANHINLNGSTTFSGFAQKTSSTVTQYCTTSGDDPSATSVWKSNPYDCPSTLNNPTLWSRVKTTFADGSITYSAPIKEVTESIMQWCKKNGKTIIDGATIITGSIDSNQIKADAIGAGHIDAGQINAHHLTADAISTIALSAKTAVINELDVDSMVATAISTANIDASRITSGVLNASRLNGTYLSIGALTTEAYANIGGDIYGASIYVSGGVGCNTIVQGSINADSSGGNLYNTWKLNNASIATSSDRAFKNTINSISDKYSIFFNELKPVTYKYNNGTSDRLHVGFIAQDVAAALEAADLSTQNFAGYVLSHEKDNDGNDVDRCYLRYEEFIALCVDQIQKQKARTTELENEVNSLKDEVAILKEQMKQLLAMNGVD